MPGMGLDSPNGVGFKKKDKKKHSGLLVDLDKISFRHLIRVTPPEFLSNCASVCLRKWPKKMYIQRL